MSTTDALLVTTDDRRPTTGFDESTVVGRRSSVVGANAGE
jgi:hypothetical protein